jgi:hypothetical protein
MAVDCRTLVVEAAAAVAAVRPLLWAIAETAQKRENGKRRPRLRRMAIESLRRSESLLHCVGNMSSMHQTIHLASRGALLPNLSGRGRRRSHVVAPEALALEKSRNAELEEVATAAATRPSSR